MKYTSNAAATTGDSVRLRYNSALCGYGPDKTVKLSNLALNPPAAPASFTMVKINQLICGQPRYRFTAPALPAATTTSTAATGYDWAFVGSLGATAVIDSGTLTSRIFTAHFTYAAAAAASGDSLKVRYTSACGLSAFRALKLGNTLTGTSVPVAPASITMTLVSNVCGARIYRYTAPVLPAGTTTLAAATGYLWSLPFGTVGSTGVIDSGNQASRVILVRYTSNASAGVGDSIRVRYTSLCGNSPNRTVRLSNIALTDCPVNIPTTKVSPVINAPEVFSVNVYPNPSKDQFNLRLSGNTTEKVSIRFMDMQGRVLKVSSPLLKTIFPYPLQNCPQEIIGWK